MKKHDPKFLRIGDIISHSSVGSGVVTGWHKGGFPLVNDVAVGNLTRVDGAKYGASGELVADRDWVQEPIPVMPLRSFYEPPAAPAPAPAAEAPAEPPPSAPAEPPSAPASAPTAEAPSEPASTPAEPASEQPAEPNLSWLKIVEPAPANSDLTVKPQGSIEAPTVVPMPVPTVQEDTTGEIEITSPDPSRAEVNQPGNADDR